MPARPRAVPTVLGHRRRGWGPLCACLSTSSPHSPTGGLAVTAHQETRPHAGRQSPFLAGLRAGPMVGDGAMGTQLYARGVAPDACFDAQNLTNPHLVEAVH